MTQKLLITFVAEGGKITCRVAPSIDKNLAWGAHGVGETISEAFTSAASALSRLEAANPLLLCTLYRQLQVGLVQVVTSEDMSAKQMVFESLRNLVKFIQETKDLNDVRDQLNNSLENVISWEDFADDHLHFSSQSETPSP